MYFVPLSLWLRQRPFVHFLVLVEWNSINLHRHRRHHIWRLLIHDKGIKRLGIYLLIAHHVRRDELTAALRKIERLHGSILDTLELTDDCLYLLEFDTETADLDLTVLTSDELDGSVFAVTDDIARAVTSDSIPFHESLGSLLGVVEITDTHLRSGYIEFARCAPRHAVTVFIDDEELRRVVRITNRDIGFVLLDQITGYVRDALSRTITVLEMIRRRIEAHQFFTTGA